MNTRHLYVIILAGGRGERFWPLSRFDRPKQNLRLFGARTMLQETFLRALSIAPAGRIYIVAGRECAGAVRRDLPRVGRGRLLIEPASRNTAAACGWAAALIRMRDPQAVAVIMPSDHLIDKALLFRKNILAAAGKAAEDESVVTIGIKPSYPATGYGYIEAEPGPDRPPGIFGVRRFVEKPDKARAAGFLKTGRYFWNSGIFVFNAGLMISLISEYMPKLAGMLESLERAGTAEARKRVIKRSYQRLDNISIDYGIMERCGSMKMVRADFLWDDMGSWLSMARFASRIGKNRCVACDHAGIDSGGCTFIAEKDKLIAAIGLSGYTVISAGNATLIARNGRLQEVKEIVGMLKADRRLRKYLYSGTKHENTRPRHRR